VVKVATSWDDAVDAVAQAVASVQNMHS